MDAGADRVAPGVGEPDPGDQPAGGAHRLFDDAGIDVYEPQLGAAEHPQRPVAGHLAPGQAEMAVGTVMLAGRLWVRSPHPRQWPGIQSRFQPVGFAGPGCSLTGIKTGA